MRPAATCANESMSALAAAVRRSTALLQSCAIRRVAPARHVAGHRALRWCLPLLAALSGACGGDGSAGAGPAADVSVSTSVASVSAPTVRLASETSVEVRCDATLNAQSSGTGKGTWGDTDIAFYDLRDTTRSLGTVSIPASDVKDAWRQDTLSGGASATSRWSMTGSTAFAATFRSHYQTAGTTRTASASLHCAPPSATVGTPPTITALTVNPAGGTLDVGTQMTVPFTANTPAGALLSILRLTGACEQEVPYVHDFEPSVSLTTGATLGWPCQLGATVGVQLITVDAVGNAAVKTVSTGPTLSDSLRPTTWAVFWGRQWLDYLPSPYGEYLAPDTLYAEVEVQDNYKVRAIYLEVYPFGVTDTLVVRDSVLVSSSDCPGPLACGNLFPVVLRPEWAGDKLQFRFYGRDVQGMVSNVYTTVSGCVQITASTVNAPYTPNKPLYDPPCVYGPGDPAPSRTPSSSRLSRTNGPIWDPPIRSATSWNVIATRRYDAHALH
jgi:hypothetical protein